MKTDDRKVIGRNIRRFREAAKMSQPELARLVGVPANTLATWEQGRRNISLPYLSAVADVFGRSMDDFRLAEPPEKPSKEPRLWALSHLDRPDDPLYQEFTREMETLVEQKQSEFWRKVREAKTRKKS